MPQQTQYQVYVTVDSEGNLTSCEVGKRIVRIEPCDFFFLVDEELGEDLMVNAQNYKVVMNGFRPELVKI